MIKEDHSIYGYLSRRSDSDLLVLLGKLRLEKQTADTRSTEEMVTQILTSRGVDTNIDLSLVIPGRIRFFHNTSGEEAQDDSPENILKI